MNKVIITVVVIAVILLGIVWFYNTNSVDNGASEEVITEETENTTETEEVSVPNIHQFIIDGTEFAFSMDEIKVKTGDAVVVVFRNSGAMPHDFVIDEFNVATAVLSPGEEEVVEFTVNQAGEFEYYCSVGNHRAQGMFGKLIVE